MCGGGFAYMLLQCSQRSEEGIRWILELVTGDPELPNVGIENWISSSAREVLGLISPAPEADLFKFILFDSKVFLWTEIMWASLCLLTLSEVHQKLLHTNQGLLLLLSL